jgi:hypothetical protein
MIRAGIKSTIFHSDRSGGWSEKERKTNPERAGKDSTARKGGYCGKLILTAAFRIMTPYMAINP